MGCGLTELGEDLINFRLAAGVELGKPSWVLA